MSKKNCAHSSYTGDVLNAVDFEYISPGEESDLKASSQFCTVFPLNEINFISTKRTKIIFTFGALQLGCRFDSPLLLLFIYYLYLIGQRFIFLVQKI